MKNSEAGMKNKQNVHEKVSNLTKKITKLLLSLY